MKKTMALLLAMTMLFALTACGRGSAPAATTAPPAATRAPETAQPQAQPPTAEPEVPAEPIKIGHICDLTGVQALTGAQNKQALEFAVASLGGEIAGRPVEIITEDAQNDATTAVDVAKKLVEVDGVAAIFGPTQNGQKTAVAEYVNSVGIPLIFYNPTPGNLWQGNDWIVGSNGGTPQMPSVMADYAYNELNYRTVNAICPDNVGARAFIDEFEKTFVDLGGEITSKQYAPVPTADYAPYFISMKQADAILAWASGSDAISLWLAWYEYGINEKMPIITPMHGGFCDYYIANAVAGSNPEAAQAMIGTYAPIMWVRDLETEENKALLEGWVEEYGEEPGFVAAGSGTQAVYLLRAAIEATGGDTDPGKLIKAIFEVDFTGPEGYQFFDNSQVATKDVYMVQVIQLEDGSFNYGLVKTYKDVPPTGLTK